MARKFIFISILYMVAASLFFNLGTMGPGMLYFSISTFFTILIFPKNSGYWSVAANAIICVAIGYIIHKGIAASPLSRQYTLSSWAAVSINIVVLSLVMVELLPRLFYKIKESHERYEIVAKATGDTIWDWNIEYGLVDYNSGIQRTFGHEKQNIDTAEAWWNDLVHPDDREELKAELNKTLNTGARKMKCEYRLRCADGSYKVVYSRAYVVNNSDGRPSRMIGAIQDISALRAYITAIEQQNTRLKEIAWIQSHKVRGPVASILGLCTMLHEEDPAAPDFARIVAGIKSSCENLDDIIREINGKTELVEEIRA